MAKSLTKAQVWTNVQKEVGELIESSKVSKKFSEALMLLLEQHIAPKNGGGSSINPPKLDEDGNIIEAWCRFHQRYEIADDMVISNGKSKGYCKASISHWTKTNSEIKKLDSQVAEAVANGDFEAAQDLVKMSKELKDNLNKPEFYDYDRDWDNFNKPKAGTK